MSHFQSPSAVFGPYSPGSEKVDETFECDAPQFVDFDDVKQQDQQQKQQKKRQETIPPGLRTPSSQVWFDTLDETPLSQRDHSVQSLLEHEELLSDEHWDGDTTQLPHDINGQDSGDEEEWEDQDLTPRPMRRSSINLAVESPIASNTAQQQELQQSMSKLKIQPHTPARKSKLCQSIVAGDLHHLSPEKKTAVAPPLAADVVKRAAKPVFVPTRSTKLTVPKEFNFASTRIRSTVTVPKAQEKAAPVKAPVKKHAAFTVPKPFKLASKTTFAASAPAVQSPYVPLAVKLRQVDRTPDRFKQRPISKPKILVKQQTKLTVAKSPKLMTAVRNKNPSSLAEPTEERILKEMKSHGQFKARPLDMRVLNSAGDLGVPRIKKAEPTIPYSPAIQKPKAPPMAEPSPQRIVRAKPYQPPAKTFQPLLPHRMLPVPTFQLSSDGISQRKKAELEAKKKQEEQERSIQFKAQPLPILDEPARPLTEAHSPMLRTKVRGQIRPAVEEPKPEPFRAQPIPSTLHHPYQPKKVVKPPTENDPVMLNTEKRIAARKDFDEEMQRKQHMLHDLARQQELEQKEVETRDLRKQAEFKARPIRTMPVFEPKKSEKPLTDPMSPLIGEKRKMFRH